MRIAFFSDIHFEWRDDITPIIEDGSLEILFERDILPRDIEADILCIAGDVHHDAAFRTLFKALLEKHYNLRVLMTEGNHDFYGHPFPVDQVGDTTNIDGVIFAMTPLWTRLTPGDEVRASTFPDFKKIEGITTEKWNQTHENQLLFLRASHAHVIITHHAPFLQSSPQRYERQGHNAFYVNDLDPTEFPNCQFWIHGHVHDTIDYKHENIRVVCSPIGYPWKRSGSLTVAELDFG